MRKMLTTQKIVFFAVFAFAMTVAGATAASAQAPCSDSGPVPVLQPLASGGFFKTVDGIAVPVQTDFKVKVKDGAESVILDPDAQQNVFVRICVPPGARFPWHTHPGAAVVTIQSGALTLYEGDDPTCTGTLYGEHQSFVDKGHGHVHTARNEGVVPVDLMVLFIDVPVGGSPLTPVDNPGNCVSKGL